MDSKSGEVLRGVDQLGANAVAANLVQTPADHVLIVEVKQALRRAILNPPAENSGPKPADPEADGSHLAL